MDAADVEAHESEVDEISVEEEDEVEVLDEEDNTVFDVVADPLDEVDDDVPPVDETALALGDVVDEMEEELLVGVEGTWLELETKVDVEDDVDEDAAELEYR